MDSDDDDTNVILRYNENHPFYGEQELGYNNTSMHKDYSLNKESPHNAGFVTSFSNVTTEDHFCKQLLYVEILNSRVRIWDVVLLIPVLVFLVGLLLKVNAARLKLKALPSPIYSTFYFLIWLNVIIGLIRCVVSMSVNAATVSGDEANILLYIGLRFFLLATEMSVVTFAILFGHLDNRTSIRRVLVVTCIIALPYCLLQMAFELLLPDRAYFVESKQYQLFAHGGSIFFFVSSCLFTLVYCFLLLLKLDCIKRRFIFLLWMPTKRSFYMYLAFLAILNALQSIGCALYIANLPSGLCIIDITTWAYFSLLTPFIYFIFVYKFFSSTPTDNMDNIVFSYRSEEEDTASIPPNQPDTLQNTHNAYSSLTEEDSSSVTMPGFNPLYTAALHSPDSMTGYSLNSCESISIAAYDRSQTDDTCNVTK